jgi:hypothetical protein
MSARLQSASAVFCGSGEVADHGVAFRPEANVGQVISGIVHSGWCDHSFRSSVPSGRSCQLFGAFSTDHRSGGAAADELSGGELVQARRRLQTGWQFGQVSLD